jgi:hypothetical protein
MLLQHNLSVVYELACCFPLPPAFDKTIWRLFDVKQATAAAICLAASIGIVGRSDGQWTGETAKARYSF